tara:strand:- start:1286 stop:1438 length:153 start_codon:yes stop_codon:yes gene_type:complete
MTNFKTDYGGKLERDMDWQDGMNAFREWTTKQLNEIHLAIEEINKKLKEK